MLYLASAALALIVPVHHILTPPAIVQRATVLISDGVPESLVFPAGNALAGGLMEEKQGGVFSGPTRDVYAGSVDLSAMLDNIPSSDLDLDGDAGVKADMAGVKRLKERQAREAERAFDKYEDVLEQEARMGNPLYK